MNIKVKSKNPSNFEKKKKIVMESKRRGVVMWFEELEIMYIKQY